MSVSLSHNHKTEKRKCIMFYVLFYFMFYVNVLYIMYYVLCFSDSIEGIDFLSCTLKCAVTLKLANQNRYFY